MSAAKPDDTDTAEAGIAAGSGARPLPRPPQSPKLSTPGLVRLELSRVYRSARRGQITWQVGCQAAHILTSLHRMLTADDLSALETRLARLEASRP
jgi:hypothetical protein